MSAAAADRGRVAELRAQGEPLRIAEYDVPEPAAGELVLRMQEAAICGSDLHVWRGDTAASGATPSQLGFGHEGFGRVHAVGPGAGLDDAGTPLAVGDRVIHHVMASHVGRGPDPNLRPGYGEPPYFFSTFADYLVVGPTRPVHRVPDELADDVLAPVNCAVAAAAAALQRGGVGLGSRVVVLGAGGLGLTAAAVAREMGARHVVVQDRLPARLALARRFGADTVVDAAALSDPADRTALVLEATQGGGDVVLDFVGLADLLPEGLSMLAPHGTFVEVGLFYTGTRTTIDPSVLLRRRARLIGSAGYPAELIPVVLDLMVRTRDRYPWSEMVSHRFPLEQINEAFAASEWADGGEVVRAAVCPASG